jgi:hypothetical protein
MMMAGFQVMTTELTSMTIGRQMEKIKREYRTERQTEMKISEENAHPFLFPLTWDYDDHIVEIVAKVVGAPQFTAILHQLLGAHNYFVRTPCTEIGGRAWFKTIVSQAERR